MKVIRYFFILVSSAVLLPGCRPEQPPTKSGIVAEVGGERITAEELALELKYVLPGGDQKSRALQQLLERKRMAAQARAAGLAGDAEARRALDGVLIRRLQEKVLQPQLDRIAIPEAELVALYDQQKSALHFPGSTTLAMVFLPSHSADNARREANRAQLEALRKQVAALEPAAGFGALAVDHSQHAETRYRGGLLAPYPEGQIPSGWQALLVKSCQDLPPGGLSEVVETADGLYLARLVERTPGRSRSFEEVRETLQRDAARAGEKRIRSAFLTDLQSSFPATVHEGEVAAVAMPSPASAVSRAEGPPAP